MCWPGMCMEGKSFLKKSITYSCVFMLKRSQNRAYSCNCLRKRSYRSHIKCSGNERWRSIAAFSYKNAAIGVNLWVVNKRSYMVYKTQLEGDM